MPRVEANKPLLQALLIRLYQKKIRLRLGPDGIVPKKAKGSTSKLTHEEKSLIDDHQPQLLTMLRYDWEYGKELIRDVHGQLAQAYPIGRGCDISEANEMIQKALDRLEKEDMHGLWYWLHRGLERGLAICEDYRNKPVLEKPREEVS